jgi:hypothetical protein
MRVLAQACANMLEAAASFTSATDSCVFRGKLRSLLDASSTTVTHAALLLDDVAALCGSRAQDGSTRDLLASARRLQGTMAAVQAEHGAAAGALQGALSAQRLPLPLQHAAPSVAQASPPLTQLQKQLTSTAALDGRLRALGAAHAALLALWHAEDAAVAAGFFCPAGRPGAGGGAADADAAASEGASAAAAAAAAVPPPLVQARVLKLADCSMKRLRNGDVYRVS